MQEIYKAKDTIAEMQEQLIDYLAAGEDTQDLTHLFSKLSVENPVAYELMMLMYQELQTKAKLDRKRLTKVITSILSQNNLAYDKIIQHEMRLNHDKNNDLYHDSSDNKESKPEANAPVNNIYGVILKILTPKMILTLLISMVTIVTTITLLARYNPEVYNIVMHIINILLNAKKD